MAKNDNTVVAKELRDRTDAELESLLGTKAEELHRGKFKHALGQLRETHTLKVLRRDIARIRTVLTQRNTEKREQA